MYVLGLTGGIGSGKTAVSEIFKSLGAAVIDADEISHEITQPGKPAIHLIQQQWGDQMISNEGVLDRIKLRQHVFSDPEQLRILESILHPAIEQAIKQQTLALRSKNTAYCLIVIPLLFEKELRHLVDAVITVDIPTRIQIERVMQRDNVSQTHVKKIINQQLAREQRIEMADYIIENSGSIESLRTKVDELHSKFSQENDQRLTAD